MSPYEVFIPIVMFLVLAFIIKFILDYNLKKKIIEKGLINEKLENLVNLSREQIVPSSLKWGMVLIFIGVTLFILKVIPYYIADEVVFALLLIAAGTGLLLFYFIAENMKKKQLQEKKTYKPISVE